jgi:hypothetical protein
MLTSGRLRLLFFTVVLLIVQAVNAQQYDLFEIRDSDLYWHNTYQYNGNADSLRREVVQMLKSKFYTFNVIRNEAGYNGELRHYKVDCKKYGRKFFSTPHMYWDGEWTGKFVVEVFDHHYRVTIYALYAEKVEKTGYYKTERITQGRYVEAVMRKDGSNFKSSEHHNLALMSVSLKDQFDIRYTVSPIDNSQVRY